MEVCDNRCQFIHTEEILTEHRSVCKHSVTAFKRHGCS
jgi:hypothetical protein